MDGLVVFTAITGKFNNVLREPLWREGVRPVHFVCFSDFLAAAPAPWHLLPPVWEHENPRRTARWHKVMVHELFPDAEYWLWADGNQQLAADPWSLVDQFLPEGTDIATYKHPLRKCVHEELNACVKLKKDKPQLMRAQVTSYQQEGYPKNNGMCETTVMLRRNTEAVREFNEVWWRQIRDGSLRDQLSFNYAVWKTGLKYGHLPGRRDKPKHFKYYAHR
jgi:hypothetical protein